MPLAKHSDHFVLPNVMIMVVVTLGLLLTVLCTFKPDVVPYDYLGPLGALAHYLAYKQTLVMQTICYTAIFMHVLESFYAYYLAGMKELSSSARLKWGIGTFFFGIFCMYQLLKYNPTKGQKRE
ncbi:transmembrane protein 254-like [Strongylocentrotus purpuratus]|uniref:Transmembrane protein 254 n=1 Tax=Strongylocentrotus purpuratus TaxID=7668 RepID=A0A7M7NLU4_STRPU|nr:transmembrane protein 254-like [Strongylocentrotus purpuratus]